MKNNRYYIEDNLVRYINYQYKTNKNDNDVIKEVNCNKDYEEYTIFNKAKIDLDTSILVNKYYRLDEKYVPDDLVEIDKKYSIKDSIRKEVNDNFIKMCDDALKEKLYIINTSGYRSYDRQKKLFSDDKIKTIAKPGYSEHQTGLALDLRTIDVDIDKFDNTKEFKWLSNNSYKYGFILRYPKGKEYLTGYDYEPWHYRYVGYDIAKYIHDNDITFDEYYEFFINKKRL